MTTTEKSAPALDAALLSLVQRGDVSALKPEERAKYYIEMCEKLGLNPHSQPFQYLRLNGKEILYATRGATDQLAAIHRLNREIVDGPKLIDLGGTPLVFAVCRATHPNGRFETATATVPFTDPINVLMKAETKCKRRATLSILGLGLLDEMELETIPDAAKEPGSAVNLGATSGKPDEPKPEPSKGEEPRSEPATLVAFRTRVGEIELPGEGVSVWMKYRAEFASLSVAQREGAWALLCGQVEKVGKMVKASVWLKKAIAEEDARRQVNEQPRQQPAETADPNAPQGSRAWANFQGAIASAPTVAAVVDLYAGLQRDLHEEGEDANRYMQDDAEGAGAGTLASDRVYALGHRLSKAEMQELLVNADFARLLDGQAAITAMPQAAAWWRQHRAAAKQLSARASEGLYYALARRLSTDHSPTGTKKANAALKAAVDAADKADKGPPRGPGGGGAPTPSAPSNDTSHGAEVQTHYDGTPAIGAYRATLVVKPSAGAVAGSYWAHRAEFVDCEAELLAMVLDELKRRDVENPRTFLDGIGRKNGHLPPLAEEKQAA